LLVALERQALRDDPLDHQPIRIGDAEVRFMASGWAAEYGEQAAVSA
jgi:hypothetical protein